MSENKTRPTDADVLDYINSLDNKRRKEDALTLLDVMQDITGEDPQMWGSSIIGFGQYHYKYESGREGDFFLAGFSPRKTAFTVYVMPGFDRYEKGSGEMRWIAGRGRRRQRRCGSALRTVRVRPAQRGEVG